ncbi:MAG: hypothetical protein HUJ71_04245 [Pseudobutyrivibrio sp.]|nr:hypothetical protein [Pseudobutyrivibrio sp.]
MKKILITELLLIFVAMSCVFLVGNHTVTHTIDYIRDHDTVYPKTCEGFDINMLSDDIFIGVGSASAYGTDLDCSEERLIIHRDGTVDLYLEEVDWNTRTSSYIYIGSGMLTDVAYQELTDGIDYNVICDLTCKDPGPDVCDGGSCYIYLFDKNNQECWYLGGLNVYGDKFWEYYRMVSHIAYSAFEGQDIDELINNVLYPPREDGLPSDITPIEEAYYYFTKFLQEEHEKNPDMENYTYMTEYLDEGDIPELLVDNNGQVTLYGYSFEKCEVEKLNYDLSYVDERDRYDIVQYKNQVFRFDMYDSGKEMRYTYCVYDLDKDRGMVLSEKKDMNVEGYMECSEEAYGSNWDMAYGRLSYEDILNRFDVRYLY